MLNQKARKESLRLTRDTAYFLRKDFFDQLKHIKITYDDSESSIKNQSCHFLTVVNPMITSQHIFTYFEAYSTEWTNFILVCKDWFKSIVMEDDGLLWRENYRIMFNSMTKYYSTMSPLNCPLNYKLERFDSIHVGGGGTYSTDSNSSDDYVKDEKFKEIPNGTWKENYDNILIHSLGLKKHETEFDKKTTRYIAKCFLDEHVKWRHRGELATTRELFLHKFLFDAIFPMSLLPSVKDTYTENPSLNSLLTDNNFKIIEKKLYFIETTLVVDPIFNSREMKKGLMFRISYLSPLDGLVHYRFYGSTQRQDNSLKFLIDVVEDSLVHDTVPTKIHDNLKMVDNFETVRLNHLDFIDNDILEKYLTELKTLLCKKLGNIHLAELFCKYWYCINRLEDPIAVSFSDHENPFWFIDILSKRASNSIEKKLLNGLSVSYVYTLKQCQSLCKDKISLDSFNAYNGSGVTKSTNTSKKKNKKQASDLISPEYKEVIQMDSKLSDTFNLSVPDCWNNRGISIITTRKEDNDDGASSGGGQKEVQEEMMIVLKGLLCSREGIVKFEMSLNNSLEGLFGFSKLN